ncbi:MAG: DUF4445 domain-containing protein [Armatimonadetes bacterium]|nr:DUF4445 domain-containing protein [Armatimonadota bacterium]
MSSKSTFTIRLEPIGTVLTVTRGTPLRDVLFEQGVEFPCGGNGRCRGCRVRVLQGSASLNDTQRERLSLDEIANGWRLACQMEPDSDLVIELRQWDIPILANDAEFAFTPREGLGIAVDVGTTTLVAQLLDLSTGHVLGVRSALNPQAQHGADVMSRVELAVTTDGARLLTRLIRGEVGGMIRSLLDGTPAGVGNLRKVTVVGNTVMHHLFCGVDLEPLSHYPFEPVNDGEMVFSPGDLDWDIVQTASIHFLPCLGGFVGSDVLAGVMATGLAESRELVGLVDLGTNGEIVIGNRDRMLCASTAAGPAFEGARISTGMRASTGAIFSVQERDGEPFVHVIGDVPPIGICGSGLVDAVAAGLDLGRILPSGRLARGLEEFRLAPSVVLTQTDIRQLQLAKGAISAGIRILLAQWGAEPGDLTRLYLAGAFGNYINRASARRIGLLDYDPEIIVPMGNTALLGAKLALFSEDGDAAGYQNVRNRTEHVSLNTDPAFQDTYVEEMLFPPE